MDGWGIFQNIIGQGPIFWIAAAAIAGGMTLLVVSLVLQTRKTLSAGFPWLKTAAPWSKSSPKKQETEHFPEVTVTENGYGVSGSAQIPLDTPAKQDHNAINSAEAKALGGLLHRLRQAGDQLETLQNNVSSTSSPRQNSLLKQQSENVEYLIRTGIS